MAGIQGFGGGLDVTAIVTQAMRAERLPVTKLQSAGSKYNSQAAAYRELKSKLLALSTAAQKLGAAETAMAKTATSSDTSVFTASATASAVGGNYEVTVGQLATTDTHRSGNFLSASATLLTGSFQLKVGSGTGKTITIDSSNNTLTGLRDAINNSGAEVSASIVQDGSNHKLAVISKQSGASKAITFDNFSNPAHETQLGLTRTVTLQDAQLTVNGITVTSSSNTVTGALQGITLNLIKNGTSKVSIASDTKTIGDAAGSFLSTYNDINTFFNAQFKYDSVRKTAGTLAGDGIVRRIQSQLQQALSSTLSGLATSLTSLKDVGVSMANDGALSLDSAKLTQALENNATAVANVFRTTARFTDARASLVATSARTQSGTYDIYVSSAATAATVTGGAVVHPTSGLTQSGTLTLTYRGTEHSVSLSAGNKIADIVDAINARLQSDGVDATASNSGGRLTLSTQNYGSGETLAVRAGASISAELGIATLDQSATGQDVAGTINGTAASGSGQLLLANSSGSNEQGLAVAVTAAAAEVGSGISLGTASVTVGFSGLLQRKISDATTSTTGSIDSALNGLDRRSRDVIDSITALEERLAKKQALLTEQLIRADSALKDMQSQMAKLSNQLASLG